MASFSSFLSYLCLTLYSHITSGFNFFFLLFSSLFFCCHLFSFFLIFIFFACLCLAFNFTLDCFSSVLILMFFTLSFYIVCYLCLRLTNVVVFLLLYVLVSFCYPFILFFVYFSSYFVFWSPFSTLFLIVSPPLPCPSILSIFFTVSHLHISSLRPSISPYRVSDFLLSIPCFLPLFFLLLSFYYPFLFPCARFFVVI